MAKFNHFRNSYHPLDQQCTRIRKTIKSNLLGNQKSYIFVSKWKFWKKKKKEEERRFSCSSALFCVTLYIYILEKVHSDIKGKVWRKTRVHGVSILLNKLRTVSPFFHVIAAIFTNSLSKCFSCFATLRIFDLLGVKNVFNFSHTAPETRTLFTSADN